MDRELSVCVLVHGQLLELADDTVATGPRQAHFCGACMVLTSITLAGSLMAIRKRAKASRMHVRLNSA